jgi:YfiH family protein
MIEVPALMANPEFRHGFFGRRGGWSSGLYESLNCGFGSNDDPATVARNRTHVATALGMVPQTLVTPHQTHSADVVVLEEPPGDAPCADALVTARTGLAIGVLTADCVPVLLADAGAEVIAAAHAGWKGALGGIIEATIAAMERLGAARWRIAAAVGPAIQQESYEVGPEYYDRFIAADAASARFFAASGREGHHLFDLPGYCATRLAAAGLGRVDVSDACTCRDGKDYFSYRRATHRGEPDYGRQISAITLGPSGFALRGQRGRR